MFYIVYELHEINRTIELSIRYGRCILYTLLSKGWNKLKLKLKKSNTYQYLVEGRYFYLINRTCWWIFL